MDIRGTLEFLRNHGDYVLLRGLDGVAIDLRYAAPDNFMGKNVYGEFNEAFLHRVAADKLVRAVHLLRAEKPGWRLLVFDALRPRSIQRVLWAHVEGTDQERYVAQPERGSVHNFGLAVDLTCLDEHGRQVEMGSGFDFFHAISQPRLEAEFLASGELSPAHHANRLALRGAMVGAGFIQNPSEWWHFDALSRGEIREGFLLIE